MVMIATASGFEFIKTILTADTGAGGFMTIVTGLFRDIAPAKQASPWAIMQAQSPPQHVTTMDAYRVLSDGLFYVKVVGKADSDYATMVAAMKRVDMLLKRTSGAVTDGKVLMCVGEGEISYSEDVDGIIFSHLGEIYRLLLQ
jgi:hypothetical protein